MRGEQVLQKVVQTSEMGTLRCTLIKVLKTVSLETSLMLYKLAASGGVSQLCSFTVIDVSIAKSIAWCNGLL